MSERGWDDDMAVQWWLAELDRYGNPKLIDGAHSGREGADQALYLIQSMHLHEPGRKYAVVRVELFEPRPTDKGVNHEAVAIVGGLVQRMKGKTR